MNCYTRRSFFYLFSLSSPLPLQCVVWDEKNLQWSLLVTDIRFCQTISYSSFRDQVTDQYILVRLITCCKHRLCPYFPGHCRDSWLGTMYKRTASPWRIPCPVPWNQIIHSSSSVASSSRNQLNINIYYPKMKNVFSTFFVLALPLLSMVSAAPIADAETEELFRRTDSCTCSEWFVS